MFLVFAGALVNHHCIKSLGLPVRPDGIIGIFTRAQLCHILPSWIIYLQSLPAVSTIYGLLLAVAEWSFFSLTNHSVDLEKKRVHGSESR